MCRLDGMPLEERKKYCYCKEGDTHCGVCDCGKQGHLRALEFATLVWCDDCYEKAVDEYLNE